MERVLQDCEVDVFLLWRLTTIWVKNVQIIYFHATKWIKLCVCVCVCLRERRGPTLRCRTSSCINLSPPIKGHEPILQSFRARG